jgi:hypothetical protein
MESHGHSTILYSCGWCSVNGRSPADMVLRFAPVGYSHNYVKTYPILVAVMF